MKDTIRERVWDELEASGEGRFPFPPHGRIPNFNGADDAAERLAESQVWTEADAIKSNPDSPQRPVRRRALEAGKTVYMAVPRLRDEACFLRLDPAEIDDIDHATTLNGSAEAGVQVHPTDVEPIDMFVSGSVAVTTDGDRVGKGEGYSDLEYAILCELGAVTENTVTATTVHELQVIDDDVSPAPHDVPMDRVLTPERTIKPSVDRANPTGVMWEVLSDERLDEIPILRWLHDQ